MVKETPGTEEAKKIKKENDTAYNFWQAEIGIDQIPWLQLVE
jgi:hypothetical protein